MNSARGRDKVSDLFVFLFRAAPDSGPWATIGRHAHWNADLKRISVDLMRKTLGLPAGQVIPDVSSATSSAFSRRRLQV